jgi:hypothetical protein
MANNSVYDYPVAWEIREDIHRSIRMVRAQVADVTYNSGERLGGAL